MVILGTIVGIILLFAGGVGLTITFINYDVVSLPWIEGLLTYGVFALLGLAVIALLLMMPHDD
ncbi:MAG: hypothetical protein GX631_00895 [Dehalococcoidales bacterium]|jgi:hypothetical protein|nr:hypothetical protein [Dehalococcoidales bacterium]